MTGEVVKQAVDAISFRQLRLFESVARLGSVRRGSEECNLSQPAVTQALAKLERQIGVSLLERRANGSFLTKDGSIFYVRVRRMFNQFDAAVADLGIAKGAGARAIVNRISRVQVRSLLAVIEYRSFAFAAQAMGMTQASLQRATRDLEHNLDHIILHRTASGIVVSPAAQEFGRRIRLAIQEVEWALREIDIARGVHESSLVIGALPFGGSVLLASVLEEFIQAYPNADVQIISESATEMSKRLRFGDVDLVIGIVQETAGSDILTLPLAVTPFRVVARSTHPLAKKANISLEDLAGYDWVVGREGSSRRACFDQLFEGRTPPRSRLATSAVPIIRRLVTLSDRLALMTTYELEHESTALAGLPIGPIEPGPTVGVAMRADWLPMEMHDFFIKLLQRTITSAVN